MSGSKSFEAHQIHASLRFIQGYRFLDRCGEALIKLENVLEKEWLQTQTIPTGGSMRNDSLGMTANFNSDAISTSQVEFISLDHFLDQTCKIFDTLWQTFDVKRINVPSLQVFFQKGFNDDELEKAQQYVLDLRLCSANAGLTNLMGGQVDALDFVVVTTGNLEWNHVFVNQRRRIQSRVVRQEKQPPFDERLLRRARQLPEHQADAIAAILKLRRQHREVSPIAVQVEVEHSFETEFSAQDFDLPEFLRQGWDWAESIRSGITRLQGR